MTMIASTARGSRRMAQALALPVLVATASIATISIGWTAIASAQTAPAAGAPAPPSAAAAEAAPPARGKTPNTLSLAPGERGQAATLADAAWLAGAWSGPGLGGVSEEHWTAPAGGAMQGMYRLIRDGKTVFYELITLTEADGSLVMRLKHFNADLTAWEEKDKMVTFRLVKATPTQLFFDGLTFTKVAPDQLSIHLALRGSDGVLREEAFAMTRVAR